MNRPWNHHFLGEITVSTWGVNSSDAIIDDWKSAIRHPRQDHLGCSQTATVKGLFTGRSGADVMSTTKKKTHLENSLYRKTCQKVGRISVFLKLPNCWVIFFPTFIFVFWKLAPSFFNTPFLLADSQSE